MNTETIAKIKFLEWLEPIAKTISDNEPTKEDDVLLLLMGKVKISIDKDKLEAELKQNNQSNKRKIKI